MARPSILANTTSYAETSGASSATDAYANVLAPATANTVIMLAGVGLTISQTPTISSITWNSLTPKYDFFLFPANQSNPSNLTQVRCFVFDVSGLGAIDQTATVTYSDVTTADGRLSVLTTDGYIANITGWWTESATTVYNESIPVDSNNSTLVSMSIWGGQKTATFAEESGTTEHVKSTGDNPTALTLSSTTVSSNVMQIDGEWSANSNAQGICAVLHPRPNPFEGNPNKNIISHDIISN